MKVKCQICGKKIDFVDSIPFAVWNHLCQSCFDRQIYLKNKKRKGGENNGKNFS